MVRGDMNDVYEQVYPSRMTSCCWPPTILECECGTIQTDWSHELSSPGQDVHIHEQCQQWDLD